MPDKNASESLSLKFGHNGLKDEVRFGRQDTPNSIHVIDSICENVFRRTMAQVKHEAEDFSAFTVAACYLHRLAASDVEHLELFPTGFGNIYFTPEFEKRLKDATFSIPLFGVLSGFPFVGSYKIHSSITKCFTEKGAFCIGYDMTGRLGFGFSSDRDCMACVAKKRVAFAVIQDIWTNMVASVLTNRVYLVSFDYRPALHLFPSVVTIAARSVADLRFVCTSIGKCEQIPPSPTSHVPIIVISLGYIDFETDRYLVELGLQLSISNIVVLYFFRNIQLNGNIQRYYSNPTGTNHIAQYACGPDSHFDIREIKAPWWFALTNFGTVKYLPTDKEEYEMTIPVAQHTSFSYRLNRHPTNAHVTIWEFERDLQACHERIAASTFFNGLRSFQQQAQVGNDQRPRVGHQQQAQGWNRQQIQNGNRQQAPDGNQQQVRVGNDQHAQAGNQQQAQERNRQQIQHGNRQQAQYGNQQQVRVGNDQHAQAGNQQQAQERNRQQIQHGNRQQAQYGNQQQVRVGNWQQVREGNDQQAQEAFQQREYQGDEERERIRYQNNLRQRNMRRIWQRARGPRNRDLLN